MRQWTLQWIGLIIIGEVKEERVAANVSVFVALAFWVVCVNRMGIFLFFCFHVCTMHVMYSLDRSLESIKAG